MASWEGASRRRRDATVDFFETVNGEWLQRNAIPPEYASWGRGHVLSKEVDRRLLHLCCEPPAAADTPENTPEDTPENTPEIAAATWRLRTLYTSRIANDDAAAQRAILHTLQRVQSIEDLHEKIATLDRLGHDAPLTWSVEVDARNSNYRASHVGESGVSLGEKSHYTEPEFEEIRQKYVAMIDAIAERSQVQVEPAHRGPLSAGRSVLWVETRLARLMYAPEERRDPLRLYNAFDRRSRFGGGAAGAWRRYWNTLGLPGAGPRKIIVDHPEYVDKAFALLSSRECRRHLPWYWWWKVVETSAPFVRALEPPYFDFFERTLLGTQRRKPLWQRAVHLVDGALGDTLGRLYVQRHVVATLKSEVTALVEVLRASFAERLRRVPWMSAATKQHALAKLRRMRFKVGYPSKWHPEPDVCLRVDDVVGNLAQLTEWEHGEELRREGRRIDDELWDDASPQTVNAYYYPERNEIILPAGILQPPYFTAGGSLAENLGGIGATIGHEMTHGFDDEGRRYGPSGNLRDWWTAEDSRGFEQRRESIVRQYSALRAAGRAVNGELTCGENIADMGGLMIAQDSLLRDCRARGCDAMQTDVALREFYKHYAISWCEHTRDAAMRERLTSDPHSPERFRVNAVLSRVPEFRRLHGVKEGDAMWHPEPIDIW